MMKNNNLNNFFDSGSQRQGLPSLPFSGFLLFAVVGAACGVAVGDSELEVQLGMTAGILLGFLAELTMRSYDVLDANREVDLDAQPVHISL